LVQAAVHDDWIRVAVAVPGEGSTFSVILRAALRSDTLPPMAVTETRRRILDAALRCFLEDGYEQTTIAAIRTRAAVSNGSLFHHFPSKEAIADALYLEAITSFQAGLWELIGERPQGLRAAVRATIAHQLEWTEQQPDLARFVYARGHLDFESTAGREVAARNRELSAAFREWMAPAVERGQIRLASMTVITAIVAGPAHAIARRWLNGDVGGPLSAFLDDLADAAWAGLRRKPAPRRAADPVPRRARMTVEILSDDGLAVTQAHAIADLTPL
jgi:AcrR family transcriptional regulator